MGKVYEALNKAEKEGRGFPWPAAAAMSAKTAPQADEEQDAERANFLNYSLNTPPAAELEEAQRESVAAALAIKSQVQPTREVTLDATRVDPHLVSFGDMDPLAADQYNKLAVSLIAGAAERPLKRLLIASAQHGEGRTCVTLNLACALSHARKRVLVIDSDLQRPSVLRLLGIEAGAGMAEVLSGRANVGAAAVKVMPHGFDVLPTRERVDNSAELYSSPNFREMLHQLDPHYDFMLFDSSPLLTSADSYLLVRLIDATILVIRAGKTNSVQMAKAITPLSQENLYGVVLNRMRP